MNPYCFSTNCVTLYVNKAVLSDLSVIHLTPQLLDILMVKYSAHGRYT